MMARRLYTLVNLLIFNLLTKYATGSLSAYGARFLIALPKVDILQKEKIHFLFGTMANKIQVKITTNHYYGDQLEDSVTLRRSRFERYVLDDAYAPKSDGGKESFTYEFKGEASFSLTVLVTQLDETASSFLALPLNAWGKKYFFRSLGKNPTFHFVTLEKTEVTTHLDGGYAEEFLLFEINGQKYSLTNPIKYFKIDIRRSFMISFCSFQNQSNFRELSVKAESSEPIGLIAGNCRSNQLDTHCSGIASSKFESALEMILPEALYGTEFIYWIRSKTKYRESFIIFGEKNLTINVGGKRLLIREWDRYGYEVLGSGVITSPAPIFIIIILHRRCDSFTETDRSGDFYYAQLVPNHLFYVFYLWRFPLVNAINYLVLVVETDYINTIRLDDSMLHEDVQWSVVANQTTYSVAVFETEAGSHTVRSNVNRKFGCYISGVNQFVGYAHPAGFSTCVHEDQGTGQDVCTGGTNEESFTRGLRESEQLRLGLGFWNEWKGWTCTKKGVKIRTRSCEMRKACKGMHDDISEEPCKPSASQKICDRGNLILSIVFTVVIMVN